MGKVFAFAAGLVVVYVLGHAVIITVTAAPGQDVSAAFALGQAISSLFSIFGL